MYTSGLQQDKLWKLWENIFIESTLPTGFLKWMISIGWVETRKISARSLEIVSNGKCFSGVSWECVEADELVHWFSSSSSWTHWVNRRRNVVSSNDNKSNHQIRKFQFYCTHSTSERKSKNDFNLWPFSRILIEILESGERTMIICHRSNMLLPAVAISAVYIYDPF